MKKLFTTIIALCAIISANAQFKVTSDGNVHVKDSLSNGHAFLTIGHDPETGPTIGNTGIKAGTHVYTNKTNSYLNFGLLSTIENQNHNSNDSYGVWGEAIGATGFHNYGVVGTIYPYGKGAGIYGTTEGTVYPWPEIGEYAGYFYGEVYVDGLLTAYSLYNLSDETRMANSVSISNVSSPTRGNSTLESLLSLDVKSFNLKQREAVQADANRNISEAQAEHINQVEKAKSMQQHFGVSAQELQKIYPELVKERSDGSLVVNYVEMVPLLLRSIQELKAEVEELRAASTMSKSETETEKNSIAGGQTEEKTTENQRLMLLK